MMSTDITITNFQETLNTAGVFTTIKGDDIEAKEDRLLRRQ